MLSTKHGLKYKLLKHNLLLHLTHLIYSYLLDLNYQIKFKISFSNNYFKNARLLHGSCLSIQCYAFSLFMAFPPIHTIREGNLSVLPLYSLSTTERLHNLSHYRTPQTPFRIIRWNIAVNITNLVYFCLVMDHTHATKKS